LALRRLMTEGLVGQTVLGPAVAAVSVGQVGGELLLDLCYAEDSRAEVDCNVVSNAAGGLIEVQGTAEGQPFPRGELDALLDLAEGGIRQLLALQQRVLGS
jgi:ribonuclease PH